MALVQCQCGSESELAAEAVGEAMLCWNCGVAFRCIATSGADIDAPTDYVARLVIDSGPDRIGEQILLSRAGPIFIGKLPEQPLQLVGPMVSRHHCTLSPTREGGWQIDDHASKNGLYVNGERISSHVLADRDQLTIGDYGMRYYSSSTTEAIDLMPLPPPVYLPPPMPPPIAPPEEPDDFSAPGPVCPSCGKQFGLNAKICVPCGIDLLTGRPLVTSRGLDEEILHSRAETAASWISWFLPTGIVPIASEAYGQFKPYAIEAIALITILITVAVWIVDHRGHEPPWGPTANLMLWTGDRQNPDLIKYAYQYTDPASLAFQQSYDSIYNRELNKALQAQMAKLPYWMQGMTQFQRNMFFAYQQQMQNQMRRHGWTTRNYANNFMSNIPNPGQGPPPLAMTENEMTMEAYNGLPSQYQKLGQFHYYQLLTNAFLHEGILHIAGNLVFLLVFGNRINALVGQWKAAVLYLLLAIGASASFYISSRGHPFMPALGASGAIMGMAGMYIVLMPMSRVHILAWYRVGFLIPLVLLGFIAHIGLWYVAAILIWPVVIFLPRLLMMSRLKIFSLRGFWVLLFYIAFDVLAAARGAEDGVAHWAHLGGFLCGIALAVMMLLTRQVDARGADAISLIFGPKAWKLLGTPAGREITAEKAGRANLGFVSSAGTPGEG